MPQLNQWASFFSATVNSIAKSFGNQFPDGVDRGALETIEDKINALWISEDGTWPEFQGAIGEYKMELFKCRAQT